jgi:putative glutamine amidotransferase
MSRPLIAVSAPIEELPTAFGAQDCMKLTAAYTDAVYAAGGLPVILPVTANPPENLLDRMDGLVLTGGGDLDPGLYRESPDASVYGIRRDRDAFEVALYREAVQHEIPILAICRGMQLVNVLRGGRLVQNIETDIDHWQTTAAAEASHKVDLTPNSRLAAAFGATVVGVNSYHHQGLRELGEGLRVTAWCGDVIEGVEATDATLVAVQWHPEQMARVNPQQAALFASFVQEAATARTTRPNKEMNPCPIS